jgi:5'-nucleotidase / UDP-sugar diphosphatase
LQVKKRLIAGFVMIFIVLGCQPQAQNAGTVTILHTNDMHTQYIPMTANWMDRDPKPLIGGMVALDFHIQRLRQTYSPVLLLDAGDYMTGTPLSKIEVQGAQGGGFVKMMNLMDYDAVTLGNHEFDEGTDNLQALIDLFEADVLSANVNLNGQPLAPLAGKIYKRGDLSIGVVGVLLSDLADVVNAKNLQGVEVLNPADQVQEWVNKADAKTDLIVVLTHQGVEDDRELAQQLTDVDVIIGGHSHTRLTRAETVNGILLVQAGSKTSNLGRLTLSVAGDSITSYDYELIDTWVADVVKPNMELQLMVDRYEDMIAADYGRVIGMLLTDWQRNSRGESNLGNFVTDVMRATTGTDFALINSGGLRKNLAAGPIRKLDIAEILPFSNTLVTFACTGEQLLDLIHHNAAAALDGEHGVLQVSGLHYSFRQGNDGETEIVSARVNGEPVDAEAIYTGTTVDFVMGRAERYLGFVPQDRVVDTGLLIANEVIDYIEAHGEIASDEEGRMKRE